MKRVGSSRKGFTVVELIIVVVVIAILAAVVLVAYGLVTKNAHDTSVKSDGSAIRDALGLYGTKHGSTYTAWSSSNPAPDGLDIKVSEGNQADVSVSDDGKDWCVRVFNTQGNLNNADSAYTVESKAGVCTNTVPSDDAYAAAITRGWKRVVAGSYHTCGVSYDNKAYCWGARDNSQGGNGSATNSGTPLPITANGAIGNRPIYRLSGAGYGSCATDTSYQVYCWGQDTYGQLGNDATLADSNVPVRVNDAGVLLNKKNIIVSSGTWHSCTVTLDYSASCWGINSSGNIGDGTTANRSTPVAVNAGSLSGLSLRDIVGGPYNGCAIDTSNQLYCWGNNAYGQLGNGSTTSTNSATPVSTSGALSGKTIRKVSLYDQTCAIASDAKAYCWGRNPYGAVGNGTTTNALSPVAVSTTGVLGGKKMTSIAAGLYSTCALSDEGKAYCWGYNSNGQLGNNSTTNSSSPVAVVDTGVLAGKYLWSITAGADFYCAQATDGNAYCWGRNVYGQLGNGAMTNSLVPVKVLNP